MESAIDSAGRIVIPAEIRRRAGLAPGTRLEVRYRDGVIELEPAPIRVKLVPRGPLLVAVPDEPVEPLTRDIVESTREAVWRERLEE